MPGIRNVIRTHHVDRWLWVYMPYTIMIFNFLTNLIVSTFTGPYTSGGVMSIYVFMMTLGIITVPMNFSFLLGLGVRRKDYYSGTVIWLTVHMLVASIVLAVLREIEKATSWGTGLGFFNFPFTNELGFLEFLALNFVVFTFFCFFGFLLPSIARRFGALVLAALLVLMFVVLGIASVLVTFYELWDEVGRFFATYQTDSIWYLIPFTLLFAAIAYILLRRSTVK